MAKIKFNRNVNAKNQKFVKGKKLTGVKKRLGKPNAKSSIEDARQKLTKNKYKKVTDARDILSKRGKNVDVRSKIQHLRANVQPIGKNILRKTDRNGKISLVTNKHKPVDNMNLKIQQQLGLVTAARKKPVLKRATKEEFNAPTIVRKTINNDYSAAMLPSPYAYEDMYRWYPGISQLMEMEKRRPTMADLTLTRGLTTDRSSGDWNTFSSRIKSNSYVDLDAVDDEEMPMLAPIRPGMARTSSNVHSRLDGSPPSSSSHGILSQAKTKVVLPMGHRIVVSNLQSSVTEDDIRELFEDIGQLLVARLVRPGTAEVIYKNLKDAQKAVDTYHNRQLDGQPMKCLLVNKRPLNNPTAPAIKGNSEGLLAARKTAAVSHNSTNKLMPDISTIHKVLFQRNNN